MGEGEREWLLLSRMDCAAARTQRGAVVELVSPTDPTVLPHACACAAVRALTALQQVTVVKRVVAVEGDVVREGIDGGGYIRIPQGHCWVEGDNASQSRDSRDFGAVPMGLVGSRVRAVVWPLQSIRLVGVVPPDPERCASPPWAARRPG